MRYTDIVKKLEENGHKAVFANISRISDLKKDFNDLVQSEKVNSKVLSTIVEFDFDYSELEFTAESILVVSVRIPIIHNDFTFQGETHTLVTPPGYIPGVETRTFVKEMKEIMNKEEHEYSRAFVPIKLLSNRLGLTEYGRNNITYVKEFGSFHMLVAYYTDVPVPLEETKWHDLKRMDICNTCSICMISCPTRCISSDRDIIDIEFCITRIYEGEGVFPDWIKPEDHNSLMACFRCQEPCPVNKKHLNNIDIRASFSEEETNQFLRKETYDRLHEKTKEKLIGMGIDRYYDIFLRNLGVQPQFNKK